MLIVSILVFIYAVIQSVFGVGLLVFGTPSLLLLGYSFEQALLYLLPASLVISAFQVKEDHTYLGKFVRKFSFWTLPPMIVGLLLALTVLPQLHLQIIIAIILLFGAAVRLSNRLSTTLQSWLLRYEKAYLFSMGLVHGVSNLGGGLLTVYGSMLFKAKQTVRAHIALGYGIFAFTQLCVIFLLHQTSLSRELILFPLIAAAAFISVGRWAFHKATSALFYHGMTALMILFGAMLVGTAV
ncbi:TSUP family transporter [Oligoflexia bacterium]|nr:TSUP family transporter [Oligoflexia bacterium]